MGVLLETYPLIVYAHVRLAECYRLGNLGNQNRGGSVGSAHSVKTVANAAIWLLSSLPVDLAYLPSLFPPIQACSAAPVHSVDYACGTAEKGISSVTVIRPDCCRTPNAHSKRQYGLINS